MGSTEQHGLHMGEGIDSFIGDTVAEELSGRTGYIVTRTIPFGYSPHHMEFPGTVTLSEETMRRMFTDIIQSFVQNGFENIIFLPTHGGNFEPLQKFAQEMEPIAGVRVVTFGTAPEFFGQFKDVEAELGMTPQESGIHAGRNETSVARAIERYIKRRLVHMKRAEPGYTGDTRQGVRTFMQEGAHAVSSNGVFGNPTKSSATEGEILLNALVGFYEKGIEKALQQAA